MIRHLEKIFPVLLAITFISCLAVHAADNPPFDAGWPRELTSKGMTATVYEPQVDSWDGFNLRAHSAAAVRQTKKQEPVYGVINFTAKTLVDKSERVANLEGLEITGVKFPSAPEQTQDFLPVLELTAKKKIKVIALDSLEAALAVSDQFKAGPSVQVKNDAPHIIFASKPAVLIYIDGDPRYVPVKDAEGSLWRVLNTRVLLLKDSEGKHYLRIFDGYMEAPALTGPWTVSTKPPKDVKKAEKEARDLRQVDFMEGQADPNTKELPSLRKLAPQVYVASRPTELLVTEGEPNFAPLAGTELLYVTNTTGNIFKDIRDNKTYVLLAGRWFRANSFSGPWEYVPHKSLPADFAKIPDDSPKENVKASVPDTVQAKEALVENSIPQTTKIYRDDPGFVDLVFDGKPEFAPIQGTPLSYVVNCATPVIMVDNQAWYAVENGVWYTAPSLDGPWAVADYVPPVIYTIPSSSPLHYVTYVKVYGSTPKYVYVGYTPGYTGTVVSNDVVVYGTGYYYTPWVGSYWYGPPVTYGLGVSIGWAPWWGWGWGFGWGWGWWGWYYPPAPWWGPWWGSGWWGWYGYPAWGPGGWACTSHNFYRGVPWTGGRPPTGTPTGRPGTGTPTGRPGTGTPAGRPGTGTTAGRPGTGTTAGRPAAGTRSPYTGTRQSGTFGMAYNSRTGALVAGQKGAVSNVYTGRYGADAKGNITKVGGGQPLAAGGGSRQGGRPGGGNQVFGTHEGNVYRPSSKGNWESVNSSRKGSQAGTQSRPRDFSRAEQARQTGQQRYQSFQAHRPSGGFQPPRSGSSYGGGFSRGSGYSPGGGGYRGGGFSPGGGGGGRGGGFMPGGGGGGGGRGGGGGGGGRFR